MSERGGRDGGRWRQRDGERDPHTMKDSAIQCTSMQYRRFSPTYLEEFIDVYIYTSVRWTGGGGGSVGLPPVCVAVLLAPSYS